MPPKRPRQESTNGATGCTRTPRDGQPMYQALSCRSGNVVVLGMQLTSSVSCAGMALMRVFQGHVELLGWQPALATYYPVHSPKWSSLLVIEGRSREAALATIDGVTKKKNVHDAESHGLFTESSGHLLAKMEPRAASNLDLEEEHEADRLAKQLAESYSIVLIFRAMPLTYGNVMCYFELPTKDEVVLPGFKIIVTKDVYQSLITSDAATMTKGGAAASGGHDAKSSSQVMREFAVADPSRTIQISSGWTNTVNALERSLLLENAPQQIVVCGGKDVGKSTFCRYLVNRLLSFYDVVAFMDTDLGQPELTPPGMVSLHLLSTPLLGPGFTHMKTPVRSFFCGGTNPGIDPLYYVKSVKSLLRLYERKWGAQASGDATSMATRAVVPLVINTDGWIKSMGHDLLCSVIQDANPHHVIQLLSTTRSKQFHVPTSGQWKIHSVDPWDPALTTVQAPRSSKEMRLYRLHSYFLHTSSPQSSPLLSGLSRAQLQNLHFLTEKDRLTSHMGLAYSSATPFAVSFDAIAISFSGNPVPPSQLVASLNCSIVGLCINSHHTPRAAIVGTEPGSLPLPLPRIQVEHVHAPCVGVGLVRGVDTDRRLLFLLSPLPLHILKQVNLLVRGSISVDPLLLAGESPAVRSPYVVMDVIASDGTGSSAMQSRNNIKRKRDDNRGKQ